jgi:hypothetical protein
MSCPPHPLWFNHPKNIRWRIRAVKFIIMQFSPRPVFLPFRSNSILKKTLGLCSSPKARYQVSHPYSTMNLSTKRGKFSTHIICLGAQILNANEGKRKTEKL